MEDDIRLVLWVLRKENFSDQNPFYSTNPMGNLGKCGMVPWHAQGGHTIQMSWANNVVDICFRRERSKVGPMHDGLVVN